MREELTVILPLKKGEPLPIPGEKLYYAKGELHGKVTVKKLIDVEGVGEFRFATVLVKKGWIPWPLYTK